MKTITLEKCKNLLKERFPKFIPYWEAESALYGDQGILVLFGPFASYAIEEIKASNIDEIKNIFYLVEFLFLVGDQSVQNGVATVFLEDLMNTDPDEIKFKTVCKYLGENSLGYCRAWDKFCGVRTEGLWEDEKKLIGEPVVHVTHSQKGEESIKRLEKWLENNPTASPGDRAAAENVIKDMQDALGY